ncbi:5-(carboxyamino)imidazole ribonucleotide synthase [Pleurocapsa sp. PCC 7319]|uniref:5-(carboxyamino)imidazole ribonucleotide synthase n=1 Tax=Pleurocapsa sp. PCC 7319 TaxID=118161 RepID=UPI00034A52C2|nr:5-(carboxyamino)imidazole ribonucleotide synthase [Pleurocapsa sp. PCC 7319]
MKGKRVGVIGGGQLAWMMGSAAPSLNIKLLVQTPSQDDPAVSRASGLVQAAIDDAEATAKLATFCDVITFENEFIDLEALQKLVQQGVCFRPSLDTLAPLLDKYHQRSYLKDIGVPVPKFNLGSSSEDITSNFGFPVVLKARRHGYDGQGTFIIKDAQALNILAQHVPIPELLVEEFIPFERELGIIAARNASGEIALYPVTETYQQNQVCHWTITPADIDDQIATKVKAIARTILEQLQVVGVLGIEFFLTADRRVLVNEIAPRTHNSGHYTLDGCHTSQFAMQLRAVTDLPLGDTNLKSGGALMVNLLGFEESASDYLEKRDRILEIPHSFVHWYGKSSRPGRKLGHATVLLDAEQMAQAPSIIKKIESIWYK